MKWLPQHMTEVEIEVPDRFARKVTEMLADEGFLQMGDISYLNTEQGASRSMDWQAKANEFASLERQLAATLQSLKIDEGEPPAKKIKMVSDPGQLRPFADQMEQEVQESSRELADAQKKIEQLQSYINLITPLTDLDIPFDRIRNRRYLYSILGIIPVEKIDRFKTSMAKIPYVLLVLKQEHGQAIVLLFGTRQNKDYLRRAARSAYLTGIDLPDEYQGTPAEIIATLKSQIDQLNEKVGAAYHEVSDIRASHARRLQDLYWHVRYSRLMAEALTRYGRLRHGYLVAGWLPGSRLQDLEDQLRAISPDILIDIKDTSSEKEVRQTPIVLQNRSFLRGFQKLVTTYGLPAYNELDPTILMTFTFPLLFGAMFGDVGHGLFLAIVGLLMMGKKIKILRHYSSLGSVVFLCGLVAMIFGFLYGSVFGMEGLLPALWQRPMDNIMNLLIVTFAGGAVLLSVANILALINDYHKRHWAHFFFSSKGLAGLILYWSLLGAVVGLLVKDFPISIYIFLVTAIIGASMIFLSGFFERLIAKQKPYLEGGAFVYVIQSFFELFETLISFLSNSLSYVRVGAFAVAHAGLSSVIFILADLVSPAKGFGYWLVIALGNLFIIGFEGMIVSIQTLRLEYYEFFSKFFSGGGRKFMPFRLSKSNSQGVK